MTVQRSILKAGDLIGVRAGCPAVCGDLSVEISIDGGPVTTVTQPTVETDQIGSLAAYWVALPAGLSPGRHEVRARLVPSQAGLERVFQGKTENNPDSWRFFDTQKTGLVIVADDDDSQTDYWAVVDLNGTLSGSDTSGIRRKTVDGHVGDIADPPAYPTVYAAQAALLAQMLADDAVPTDDYDISGSTVYVKTGDHNARTINTQRTCSFGTWR